jgi:nucleoside 2-deoxyribosyltransferase
MLFYLATPYNHPDPIVRENRTNEAKALLASLTRSGMNVFCPIAYGSLFKSAVADWSHKKWMEFDLQFLTKCDGLIVAEMEGWKQSKGVQEEIQFARSRKFPIMRLSKADVIQHIRLAQFGQPLE